MSNNQYHWSVRHPSGVVCYHPYFTLLPGFSFTLSFMRGLDDRQNTCVCHKWYMQLWCAWCQSLVRFGVLPSGRHWFCSDIFVIYFEIFVIRHGILAWIWSFLQFYWACLGSKLYEWKMSSLEYCTLDHKQY